MRFFLTIVFFIFVSPKISAQKSLERAIQKYNKGSIPYIQPEEISHKGAILFDTREIEEYTVSHLKNAVWVGHKNFQEDSIAIKAPNKDSEIIVYCSIGVRSENIGEKLQKMGYTNIKNLYGGIFLWVNKGYPVYGLDEEKTDKVHAFNKHWGKLLTKGEKVYSVENHERSPISERLAY